MRILNKSAVASAIVTGSILMGSFAPVVSAATISVTNNDAGAVAATSVDTVHASTVAQSNNAVVINSINVVANTGGNSVSSLRNGLGSSMVLTGNATSRVAIDNAGDVNQAGVSVPNAHPAAQLRIDSNAAGAMGSIGVMAMNDHSVLQDNNTSVTNDVNVLQTTGANTLDEMSIGDEVGGGNSEIISGNAISEVSLRNTANGNSARLRRDSAVASNPDVSISNNGEGSTASVDANLDNSVMLSQDNMADVLNMVGVDQMTGQNVLMNAAGGHARIDTGGTSSDVRVVNDVNRNVADILGLDFPTSRSASVTGNGAGSLASFNLGLRNNMQVLQGAGGGNLASLNNLINVTPDTGNNLLSDDSAASGHADIVTGNSISEVDVANEDINSNEVGSGAGGVNLQFDLVGLLNSLLGL